jgi:hypothetical protein
MSRKTKADKPAKQLEVVLAYKGFDKDFACHPNGGERVQYEVGKTYELDGDIEACSRGFHACEYPLDVPVYYPPAGSRFALVEQSGQISRKGGNSKIASSKIKVSAEIGLPGLIKAAIEYTFSRSKPEGKIATGDQGAAMASGYEGRALGKDGNALFLVERNDDCEIVNVRAGIVGRDGIKADTWYTLRAGTPVEG